MANRVSILLEARDVNASSTLAKVNSALGSMEQSMQGGLRGMVTDVASAVPGLGALATAATGVGVAVAAWQLGGQAVELAKLGAEAQRTEAAFRQMAQQSGESAGAMLSAMQRASQGTIANSDLMLSANRAMALGVADSANEMSQLIEVAIARGKQLGVGATQAFNDLVTGIGRMSPLILDNLGIVTGGEKLFNDYAAAIGKTAAQLSDAEKKQALVNKVIAESAAVVNANAKAGNDAAESFERAAASWANIKGDLGQLFAPALASFANQMANITDAAASGMRNISQSLSINDALGNVQILEGAIQSLSESIAANRAQLAEQEAGSETYRDIQKQISDDTMVLTMHQRDLATAQQAYFDILRSTYPAAEQNAAAINRTSIEAQLSAQRISGLGAEILAFANSLNSAGLARIDFATYATDVQILTQAVAAGQITASEYANAMTMLGNAVNVGSAQAASALAGISEANAAYASGRITLEEYIATIDRLTGSTFGLQDAIGQLANTYPSAQSGAEDLTSAKNQLTVAIDLTGGALRRIIGDFARANAAAAATTETVRRSVAALGALSGMQGRMLKEAQTGLKLAPQHDLSSSFSGLGALSDVGKLNSAVDRLKGGVASTASQISAMRGPDAAITWYNQQIAAIEKQGSAWLRTGQNIDDITNILLPGFSSQINSGAQAMYGLGKHTAGVRGGVDDVTSALSSMAQAMVPTLGAAGALNWLNQTRTEVNAQVAAWKEAGYSQKEITDVLLPSYLSQLRKANGQLGDMDDKMKSIQSKTSSILSSALTDIGGIKLDSILPRQDSVSEDARRLADVAVKGFDSPWAEYLQNKYPQLIGEAFKNTGDVKGAAANILKDFQDGLRPELLDKDRAKELVKRAIVGEQNIKALSAEISAELAAEMSLPLADVQASAAKALGGAADSASAAVKLPVQPTLDTSLLPTVNNPISVPVALDTSTISTSALPTVSGPVSVPVMLDTTSVDPSLIASLIGTVSVRATIDALSFAEGITQPEVTGLIGYIGEVRRDVAVLAGATLPTVDGLTGNITSVVWRVTLPLTVEVIGQIIALALAPDVAKPTINTSCVVDSVAFAPTAPLPSVAGLKGTIDSATVGDQVSPPAITGMAGDITSLAISNSAIKPAVAGLSGTIADVQLDGDLALPTATMGGIVASTTLAPTLTIPSVHLGGIVDSVGLSAQATLPEVTGLKGTINQVGLDANAHVPSVAMPKPIKVDLLANQPKEVPDVSQLSGTIGTLALSPDVVLPSVTGLSGTISHVSVDLNSEPIALGAIGKGPQLPTVSVQGAITSVIQSAEMAVPMINIQPTLDIETGADGYVAAGFWIATSIHQGIINYGIPSAIESELLKAGAGALEAGQVGGTQYAKGFLDVFGGSVPGSVLSILAGLIAPMVSAQQKKQKTRAEAN